ncbi:PREDICTED: inositol hexakisphosphate and diphosphoinositol-pentakisphosphate kinase 1 [Rhinopithecus bieti]|uniref:inositol hexakisphosphate and diphosphoinositol-pentakisphosphate kinase 1 n=1 Tax=Rhinopithecus bieti TaxID=61621 RepID=UPI00083C2829|nr:PREDICTED: inositol hexakisphosphate and diphosphoinositol-pentakisphosphate kinase 1 [Rhinopithecus bieti]
MHSSQASDNPFSPPRTLHSPPLQLQQRSEKPPWYSSGPSSTVSSAGPSSPTTVDGNSQFGFSDQPSLNSHVTEEHQCLGLLQETPGNGAQELSIEGKQELLNQISPHRCHLWKPASHTRRWLRRSASHVRRSLTSASHARTFLRRSASHVRRSLTSASNARRTMTMVTTHARRSLRSASHARRPANCARKSLRKFASYVWRTPRRSASHARGLCGGWQAGP